jgi:hypothetical protein
MAKNLYKAPVGTSNGTQVTRNVNPIAPDKNFPERVGTYYEGKQADNGSGTVGPARFYEGLASDRDIPREFSKGAMQGYETGSRPNLSSSLPFGCISLSPLLFRQFSIFVSRLLYPTLVPVSFVHPVPLPTP